MQTTPAQKQEMMEHYERATRAYDIQKYQEAVDEYQKAYEIAGDPAMLYNVAQAYRLNGQLQEALHSYRRYLQRSPNARNREDVERKIADLEQTLEARKKTAEAEAAAARRAQTPVAPPVVVETPPVQVPPPSEAPVQREAAGRYRDFVSGSGSDCGGGRFGVARVEESRRSDGGFDEGRAALPSIRPSRARAKPGMPSQLALAIGGGVLAVVGTILIVAAGSDSSDKPAEAHGTALLTPMVGGGTFGMGAGITF